MKRPEMLKLVEDIIQMYRNTPQDFISNKGVAEVLLNVIENKGMQPPCLPDKYCQALHDVYVYPNLNQWEEVVEQDQKVMDRVKKREEWRNKP